MSTSSTPPARTEAEWVKSYRAFNNALKKKLEGEVGAAWEPRERVALLRRVRAIASTCATKEAILAALDETIDAMGYTDEPRKGTPK